MKPCIRNSTTLALLVSTFAAQALADTIQSEPEELTVFGDLSRYSALKSDVPIMETARSVSVISEQQIVERGALTVGDTYTYSAGVVGNPFGFATRGDWVRVRGFDVPQYQDSLQSLFGNYNAARPDVFTLEQVEILKGPASVLYGKGSPGGLVNLVSKRPKEERATQVRAQVGNFSYKELALDSTGNIDADNKWLYRFVGLYRDTDTQVDFVEEEKLVVAPSLTWQASDATRVTLLLNHTDTKSDTGAQFVPIAGTLFPADNGKLIESSTYLGEPGFNQYDTTTSEVTVLAEHEFNEVWSAELTARYSDSEATYRQAWPAFSISADRYVRNPDNTLYGDGTVPRSFYASDATSDQSAVDFRLRGDFATGRVSHNTLFGVQYQDVNTDDDGYYAYAIGYDFATGGPDATFGDTYWINVFEPVYGNVPPAALLDTLYTDNPESNTEDFGIYVSDEISIDNWRILLGLRYDDVETKAAGNSQKDDALSFSSGVLYRFDNGIAPYINYAESFEPVLGLNSQNEPFKPQEGDQFEAGIKYEPDSFPGALTFAWFDIEQSNLSDPSSLPGMVDQQRGKATSKGFEIEGTAVFGDFDVFATLSNLETRNAEGFRFASVPDKQASTWINYKPGGRFEGFRIGVGIRYIGESWGGTDTIRTPSYTLGDAAVGYATETWEVSLNVRNIADKEHLTTCLARGDCFFGEERTVVGRLSVNF